ncbi:hypothetical protein SLS55_003020 [Diplodia seriata]|uniref:Uncharacterized protein n=1 Tax=Diplodia seriata TaxID=420778 RepID=A0ABR3CLU9_9PEZI
MDNLRSQASLKGRPKPGYDIRAKDDWDGVYDLLAVARTQYQREGGAVGLLRRVRRRAADNVGPVAETARISSKLTPNDSYATPVLGAVEVLLDAVKTAANVRKQVLEGFDGLIPIFSDVELFLGTFPQDHNIWNASVDLTTTTLEAVERAIAFFVSNEFRKGASAIFHGSDYQASLLESLKRIEEKSRNLMGEAMKSHIHEVHIYSRETRMLQKQILEEQKQMRHEQQQMADGLFNRFNDLLTEHERSRNRLQAELSIVHQENMYLKVQNWKLEQRRLTPSPPPQPPSQAREWFINQTALRRMLDIPDFDLIDAAFINDKKPQLSSRHLAQAEQIASASLFHDWMVSPRSARLLVQWDAPTPPRTVGGISPLSTFCAAMARALQTRGPRFIPLLWFCGRHSDIDDEENAHTGARSMLASLIDQLLRRHDFDTRPLHRDLDLSALQSRSPVALAKLLDWLIRHLPPTTTVVLIVDGVVLFEREEFQDEALPALSGLLRLAADDVTDGVSGAAAVKVLFASAPGTDVVRAAFEPQGLVLDVGALPRIACAPSEERLARELEGEAGGV